MGLATALAAQEYSSDLKIKIYEKEPQVGLHMSGRNSGVLHAGFYYSSDSLKSKFCKEGNLELRQFCSRNSIPILETGKVVVTRRIEEEARLDILHERGEKSGVETYLLNKSELSRIEPVATTVERFLWSPTTAVSSPRMILDGMLERFTKQGGKIEFNSQVELLEINNEVVVNYNKQIISSKKVINAAGAHSDRLARTLGVGTEYLCVPFLGEYRKAVDKMDSKTLIYPVPHPLNPFLGVHTTLTLDGYIKIGPTAFPTTGREAYKLFQKFNFREFVEILQGQFAIAKGDKHDLIEILRTEAPLLFKHKLVGSVALLSPSIKRVSGWKRQPGGIRSQLVRIDTGELEQDFVVKRHLNSMHYLNLVSPGWTSALPFTRWATGKFLRDEA